ncbi:hypothetical protein R3P38DRAFT_2799449 [Favolaschia claudopus]|uniref:Uncharacterized protein n=1 Tax=Favolaschia claudopus TaxID=2862362 RepID=A0AAV9ZZH7_9AGAR
MDVIGDPIWPQDLKSIEDVVNFLKSDSVPSLVKDIYGFDFIRGRPSYFAYDFTRCLRKDGSYFYAPYIFGRTYSSADRHFKLDGGNNPDTDYYAHFQKQIAELEAFVTELREEDIKKDKETKVVRCTESPEPLRSWHSSLDSIIQVNTINPEFFVEDQGILVSSEPKFATDYPLSVNDWVIIRGAVHCYEDFCEFEPRIFRFMAHEIRVLNFVEALEGQHSQDSSLSSWTSNSSDDGLQHWSDKRYEATMKNLVLGKNFNEDSGQETAKRKYSDLASNSDSTESVSIEAPPPGQGKKKVRFETPCSDSHDESELIMRQSHTGMKTALSSLLSALQTHLERCHNPLFRLVFKRDFAFDSYPSRCVIIPVTNNVLPSELCEPLEITVFGQITKIVNANVFELSAPLFSSPDPVVRTLRLMYDQQLLSLASAMSSLRTSTVEGAQTDVMTVRFNSEPDLQVGQILIVEAVISVLEDEDGPLDYPFYEIEASEFDQVTLY